MESNIGSQGQEPSLLQREREGDQSYGVKVGPRWRTCTHAGSDGNDNELLFGHVRAKKEVKHQVCDVRRSTLVASSERGREEEE